jgi:hypothetical protein
VAPKRVACRITDWIPFGLNNAATQAHPRQIVHERFANQVAGKVVRIGG